MVKRRRGEGEGGQRRNVSRSRVLFGKCELHGLWVREVSPDRNAEEEEEYKRFIDSPTKREKGGPRRRRRGLPGLAGRCGLGKGIGIRRSRRKKVAP